VEHILQGVDIVPVDVSSMLAQSSPPAQFAVSATATLVRSTIHCAQNEYDVGLMNVTQNAWPTERLSAQDSDLPDPTTTTTHARHITHWHNITIAAAAAVC